MLEAQTVASDDKEEATIECISSANQMLGGKLGRGKLNTKRESMRVELRFSKMRITNL